MSCTNVAMAAIVWLFFCPTTTALPSFKKDVAIKGAVFFLFGLAPGLYFFNWWPYNLSLTMYSGMSMEAQLTFDLAGKDCFPLDVQDLMDEDKLEATIEFDDWTNLLYNVPTYSSTYVYQSIAKKWCPCLLEHHGSLHLFKFHRIDREPKIITIDCETLLK